MNVTERTGLLLATAVAFTLSMMPASHTQPVTLRIGIGNAAEEPMFLLRAKPELGTNFGKSYVLDVMQFASSDKRAQAFEANAIDISVGAANGVIFAAAEGVAGKIIASLSKESSRGFSTRFYVKENSPIKTVADMKGKTIGINGFSTSGHLWLRAALGKVNLADSDVTLVPVPFSAMEIALESGKIDVGMFPQPYATLLERQIKVRTLFDAKYGVPFDEELTVVVTKDEFAKKNSAAVRGFLADLKTAMQYYLSNTREAKQALVDAKLVRVPIEVYASMRDYYRDPTLKVDVAALEQMQAFQVSAGFQKKAIDVRSLVDLSYLD